MNHHCAMKGFLSFLILWLLHNKKLSGAEVALELQKRKGNKPSPGTIYPVLKDLKYKGLLTIDKDKRYTLTKKGQQELETNIHSFLDTFWDIDKMRSHCCCHEPNNTTCDKQESK